MVLNISLSFEVGEVTSPHNRAYVKDGAGVLIAWSSAFPAAASKSKFLSHPFIPPYRFLNRYKENPLNNLRAFARSAKKKLLPLIIIPFWVCNISADPIVWDLGPTAGTPYEWGAANIPTSQNYVDDILFSANMSITGLHLFTSAYHSPTSSHHIKFFMDSGTGSPGSLLTEFDVVPTVANQSIGIGYIKENILHFSPVNLQAGLTYWVGGSHIYNNAMVTISSGSSIVNGQFAKLSGNTFSNLETSRGDIMFQLEGTQTAPVPEPTTLALIGLGLADIGFARKKKKT